MGATARLQALAERVDAGLRHVPNWWQLGRFLSVGAVGFAVNVSVYGALVHAASVEYRLAAVISNTIALTNNFLWNRHWTFKASQGRAGIQAPRFAFVSAVGLAVNLLVLHVGVETLELPRLPAEILASGVAAPVNFLGSRQWAFRLKRRVT